MCLYVSLYLTLLLRFGSSFDAAIWRRHFYPFTLIYCIWIVVFYIVGLYDLSIFNKIGEFVQKLLISSVINFFIAVTFFYIYAILTPKTNLLINLGIFAVLLSCWRYIYIKFAVSEGQVSNVLLIGCDKTSFELFERLVKAPMFGYKLAAIVHTEKIEKSLFGQVRFSQNFSDIEAIVKEEKIDTVVVKDEFYQDISSILYELLPSGINVFNLPTFWEEFSQEIPILFTNEIWFLENLRGTQKRTYEIIKRGLDIFFSIIFGTILLIFYPFIIIAIKVTSSGPAFYRQERVGKNGKIFEIIKFRTMGVDSEPNGAVWTQKNDSRVTKFGRILRNLHFDEFPQLWNILKGDMSFIGPRPDRPEFIARLKQIVPHYQLRYLMRAGLTGWAQINYPCGSSTEDTLRKLQYDLYYLKNRSLILDFAIILKTINAVFLGERR